MFKIDEVFDPNCYCRPEIYLEVQGIRDLPCALKRLAELGHDMEKPLEALQEAVEEQRKRKALDAAINALTKPTEKAEK